MNKYLRKDLADLRIEKIVDKYIENHPVFLYNYFRNNINIYLYVIRGKNEQQTLFFLDKFCSAIHNALLRKIKYATMLRDYIIRCLDFPLADNHQRRRYCKVVMTILKYRTFFVYFLDERLERNIPYLDKKKLFLKNGKILIKSSRRIIKHHLIVLDFFKDYLSANDLNFIVNLAYSKNNIELIERLNNDFYNILNDYQKTKLNSLLVFSAINS